MLYRAYLARYVVFFFSRRRGSRLLHSFPTRRSSDLGVDVDQVQCRVPGIGDVDGLRKQSLRSEEHTSELQSLTNLVCRLLLGKKKSRHKSRGEWSLALQSLAWPTNYSRLSGSPPHDR